MAKNNINWNQLLLEKGDRIGLAIAAGVGVLLLLTSLFWPGSGLLATSPSENAKVLLSQTERVENGLRTNKPTPADGPTDPTVKPQDFKKNEIDDPNKYLVRGWFSRAVAESSSRRQPELLLPEEGIGEAVLAQIKSYIFLFDKDGRVTRVQVLEGGAGKDPKMAGQANQNLSRMFGGNRGAPAARGPNGAFNNANPNLGMPSTTGFQPAEAPRKIMKAQQLPVEKLAEESNHKLAETVRPLRMAEIVAAFPYKQQLDEFREKLRLPSYAAVLHEMSPEAEVDATGKPHNLPAFRFLGVRVQRREVDALGKPLSSKGDGWEEIDLNETFKPYVILAGKRTQPEDKDSKLEVITIDGLVMPRLLQAQEGLYPKLETKLRKIRDTLDDLVKANPENVEKTLPSVFSGNDFDIFKTKPADQGNKPGVPNTGVIMPPQPLSTLPGTPGATTQTDATPPSHCLIRLLDVTIQPGTIYEYRIRALMANPNYKRTDVASPKYAEDPELRTDQWYVIPQKVVVPPEMVYYAVDQKDLDGGPKMYRGINPNLPINHRDQVAFQIHHWLQNVSANRQFTPVGEWSVAERLIVNRGEYIGRTARVEVPIWMETMDGFVLAAQQATGRPLRTSGIEVNFAHANNEAILVDFEGPEVSYHRKPDGPPAVTEKGLTTEVLILSHDGKLVARDSESDKNDTDRDARLKAWRNRIKEVREQKPPTK